MHTLLKASTSEFLIQALALTTLAELLILIVAAALIRLFGSWGRQSS